MTIVKLNKTCNKAYDSDGNEVTNFDKSSVSKVQFKMKDGSLLITENLKEIDGGYYKTIYDNEVYIIDDNNRYESVVLGYLVYENYDTNNISDKEFGLKLRNDLYREIIQKLDMSLRVKNVKRGDIDFIYSIDTINAIVSDNQNRKEQGRKIFPFNKSMDKYGTFYLAIYSNVRDISTDLECNNLLEDIKNKLGDKWKFVPNEYKIKIPLML